jgi:hypothetical protein
MRTITATATVTEEGTIIVPAPPDIPVGKHEVVVVIDEHPLENGADQPRGPLDLSAHPVGLLSADFTFRREDLYHDG